MLSREDCIDRLTHRSIGRVAVTSRALPAIVPVNYCVSGSSVVFRTEPGGMLARACNNTVVAFEVDDIADDGRSGWSVLVVGVAELLEGSAALRAMETGLVSAAGDDLEQFVSITLAQVSGRVVGPGAGAPESRAS